MIINDQELEKFLQTNEYLSQDELDLAKQFAKVNNSSLYNAILEKDLLSDENLGKTIADYLEVPFISLKQVAISDQFLNILPETYVKRHMVIVYGLDKKGLMVATCDPKNTEVLSAISHKTGYPLHVYYATERDLEDALSLFKKGLQSELDELLKEEVNEAGKASNSEAPITKIVDTLIGYAYSNKASDIHIEPGEDQSLIRFRIDGVLHDVLKLPKVLHPQVVTRIKVLSKLRTDEHLSSQDGKLQIKLPEEELDVRVSIVPVVDGEKIVMRLLTSHFRQFSLTDLGMGAEDLEKVQRGFKKPYGMILSTGPTGSGKTTSMYAVLKVLNTREVNIATIEDPVEYEIDGINQIQVNPKTNLTFAEGLRSILRQDPNIIYVGEIRDEETADIAINSAMTGHLVLSTLHTNDAATALPRFVDMGIEPFLVASTVNVIIAQRLLRTICDKCKVSYTEDVASLSKKIPLELIKKQFGEGETVRLYHGKGCKVCHHTGYTGRIGVFEVLEMSEAIKDLITQKVDSDLIARQAIKEGMKTMMEDGLIKVQQGQTTIEEVLRATKE